MVVMLLHAPVEASHPKIKDWQIVQSALKFSLFPFQTPVGSAPSACQKIQEGFQVNQHLLTSWPSDHQAMPTTFTWSGGVCVWVWAANHQCHCDYCVIVVIPKLLHRLPLALQPNPTEDPWWWTFLNHTSQWSSSWRTECEDTALTSLMVISSSWHAETLQTGPSWWCVSSQSQSEDQWPCRGTFSIFSTQTFQLLRYNRRKTVLCRHLICEWFMVFLCPTLTLLLTPTQPQRCMFYFLLETKLSFGHILKS